MKPAWYQFCLRLTIFECTVALSVAVCQWVNFVPLWITMPDAEHLTLFEKYTVGGYGFWAGLWLVPNFVMLTCTDIASRRKFALLAGIVYVLWWIVWWEQVWSGVWTLYVTIFYVPCRVYQVGANLWYGLKGPDPEPATA